MALSIKEPSNGNKFTVDQLINQFQGNDSQSILELRRKEVDDFIDKYPKFFKNIASDFGSIIGDNDLIENINMGNITIVEKLEKLLEEKLHKSKPYSDWSNHKNMIELSLSGIKTMESNISVLIEELKNDWISQGFTEDNFSLETFEWSSSKKESMSKKELKKKSPNVVKNMKNIVIPKKQVEITKLEAKMILCEKSFKKTIEWSNLQNFREFLTKNKDWTNLVEINLAVQKSLCSGGSGDGGFEISLIDEEVQKQWYPFRLEKIKDYLSKSEKSQIGIDEIISRLQVMQNVEYVIEYKKGKKEWKVPFEQDIIIYDPVTNIVYDCGEAKSNYNDIGHADKQLIRNCTIIGRNSINKIVETHDSPFKLNKELYSEYLDDISIQNTYIARDKYSINNILFTSTNCTPLLEEYAGFIVTKEVQQNRLQVPSDVEVQISNWIYYTKLSDISYVQKHIDNLIDELNYRNIKTVIEQRDVFIILN